MPVPRIWSVKFTHRWTEVWRVYLRKRVFQIQDWNELVYLATLLKIKEWKCFIFPLNNRFVFNGHLRNLNRDEFTFHKRLSSFKYIFFLSVLMHAKQFFPRSFRLISLTRRENLPILKTFERSWNLKHPISLTLNQPIEYLLLMVYQRNTIRKCNQSNQIKTGCSGKYVGWVWQYFYVSITTGYITVIFSLQKLSMMLKKRLF